MEVAKWSQVKYRKHGPFTWHLASSAFSQTVSFVHHSGIVHVEVERFVPFPSCLSGRKDQSHLWLMSQTFFSNRNHRAEKMKTPSLLSQQWVLSVVRSKATTVRGFASTTVIALLRASGPSLSVDIRLATVVDVHARVARAIPNAQGPKCSCLATWELLYGAGTILASHGNRKTIRACRWRVQAQLPTRTRSRTICDPRYDISLWSNHKAPIDHAVIISTVGISVDDQHITFLRRKCRDQNHGIWWQLHKAAFIGSIFLWEVRTLQAMAIDFALVWSTRQVLPNFLRFLSSHNRFLGFIWQDKMMWTSPQGMFIRKSCDFRNARCLCSRIWE